MGWRTKYSTRICFGLGVLGSIQSKIESWQFELSETDDAPFWMSQQYCLRFKFDERPIPGEVQEKEYKVVKLRNILKNAGFPTDGYKK
eukprot:1386633-Ditylum_brightwellii.AAC.1